MSSWVFSDISSTKKLSETTDDGLIDVENKKLKKFNFKLKSKIFPDERIPHLV